MKTWDVLNRETGVVGEVGILLGRDEETVHHCLFRTEVAYCRETGEVVYR